MTFASISRAAGVFLDANTFVYHFSADPQYGPACRQLLDRIDRQEITAFTTTHQLSDVSHRLMTIEAMARLARPLAGMAGYLRAHPADVRSLSTFRTAVESIQNSRVQFLPVTPAAVVSAAALSQQFGLLSDDALIVAVMQAHGLADLASNDRDFDGVPGITRYAPV